MSSVALAQRYGKTNAPDFSGNAPPRHIDRSLVLSPGGTGTIDPWQSVTFANDSAQLTSAGFAQVDRAALWLKVHPRYRIVLHGYADEPGTSAYNEDLALHRIDTVRKRLRSNGIPADRIVMQSFGDRFAMDAEDPLHGADRKVTMYATTMAPDAIVAAQREFKPPIASVWNDPNGQLHVDQVPAPVTARR